MIAAIISFISSMIATFVLIIGIFCISALIGAGLCYGILWSIKTALNYEGDDL